MINLTRLWTGLEQPGDDLRYGRGRHAAPTAAARKPVVVWNITRTCNLHCVHCYSNSDRLLYDGELDPKQMDTVADDLSAYGVPAVLLSGGEPLIHPYILPLARRLRGHGLRLTLSTNGTRIDAPLAAKLKEIDFSYIGISLDGIGAVHDRFRGRAGAFKRTVEGIRHCRAAGLKVGLRLTLTRYNVNQLESVLQFIENEDIERACFYHLVPVGRGVEQAMLTPRQTRNAMELLLDRLDLWETRKQVRELLTVAQPADGPFLLHQMAKRRPWRYEEAEKLLAWNGGSRNGPGTGLACIDPQGNVHTDQFRRTACLGKVTDQPFSAIWDAHRAVQNKDARIVRDRCVKCGLNAYCGGHTVARTGAGDAPLFPACYLRPEDRDVSADKLRPAHPDTSRPVLAS